MKHGKTVELSWSGLQATVHASGQYRVCFCPYGSYARLLSRTFTGTQGESPQNPSPIECILPEDGASERRTSFPGPQY